MCFYGGMRRIKGGESSNEYFRIEKNFLGRSWDFSFRLVHVESLGIANVWREKRKVVIVRGGFHVFLFFGLEEKRFWRVWDGVNWKRIQRLRCYGNSFRLSEFWIRISNKKRIKKGEDNTTKMGKEMVVVEEEATKTMNDERRKIEGRRIRSIENANK